MKRLGLIALVLTSLVGCSHKRMQIRYNGNYAEARILLDSQGIAIDVTPRVSVYLDNQEQVKR